MSTTPAGRLPISLQYNETLADMLDKYKIHDRILIPAAMFAGGAVI